MASVVARRQIELIPRSIQKYVTRISERSQQRYGVKYDERLDFLDNSRCS